MFAGKAKLCTVPQIKINFAAGKNSSLRTFRIYEMQSERRYTVKLVILGKRILKSALLRNSNIAASYVVQTFLYLCIVLPSLVTRAPFYYILEK